MINVPLRDSSFSHTISGYLTERVSNIGKWKRDFDPANELFVVLTHTSLYEAFYYTQLGLKVYAWLIEPQSIQPEPYNFILDNFNLFEKIFTWNKELLAVSDKFHLIVHGTCWIEENECKIHNKTKNLSMMLTRKRRTNGHLFRHEIYQTFMQYLDVFGRDYKPIDNKITALKDYRFQLVVENVKEDYGITEKIIDCFQTGTIPVYWGCPSIGELFNEKGVIQFNNLKDLEKIIPRLNEDLYQQMLPYAKQNFELSKKYIMVEDQIFEFFKNDSN